MSNAAIIARLGLDSKDFQRSLGDVTSLSAKAQDKMARDAERAAQRISLAQKAAYNEQVAVIKGAAGEMAGALGISFGVGSIVAAGKAVIDFAGNLQDSSEALGISVEALQELQGAFGQSGASAEHVNKALVALSQNVVAAREGNETLRESFQRLGVDLGELKSLAPDEILMQIAGSARDTQDPAERLALILDVLGKSGAKMAGGLNGGREALAELRKEVSKISEEDAKALAEAGDMLDRFVTKSLVAGAHMLKTLVKGPQDRKTMREAATPEKPPEPEFLRNVREFNAAKEAAKPKEKVMSVDEAREKLRFETAEAEAFWAREKKHDEEMAALNRATNLQMAEEAQKWLDDRDKAEKKSLRERLEGEREILRERRDALEALYEAEQEKAEKVVRDKMEAIADPNAAREQERAARKEMSLRDRAEREIALQNRGGHSKVDVENANLPPISERVKPVEKFGPEEPLLKREFRERDAKAAAADLRNGLAAGRHGIEPKSDFKAALSTVETSLQNIETNLKLPNLKS